MSKKVGLKSKITKIIKNKFKFGFINYIKNNLALLILFSSLKINGYVTAFLFFIPSLTKKKILIYEQIKKAVFIEKFVFLYFIFLIIESIYGCLFISDIRILIYWVPFFLVCLFSYFYNLYNLNNNSFYRENYIQILYYSSLAYFIFYLLINIFSSFKYGNFFDIQDYFWVGGSSAFSASSLFLITLYYKWQNINFRLFSQYSFVLLFFIFLINLNQSRIGLLYLAIFSLFTFLRSLSNKKMINGFCILIFVISTYNITSDVVTKLTFANHKEQIPRSFIKDIYEAQKSITPSKSLLEGGQLIHTDDRIVEILIGLQKFKDSPKVNQLFGTGWYSSRITINTHRDQIISNYKGKPDFPKFLKSNNVVSMQAIVAILLDTGIIGSLFYISLNIFNIIKIYQFRVDIVSRLFFITIVITNFFCLFIGYPLVITSFFLSLLPNGLINSRGFEA